MNETDYGRHLMKLATSLKARLFRNNTGMGWTANKVTRHPDGSITLHHPRPLHAGLCVGSSDLIGWTPVQVTPEMVGSTVAVFTAVEVKKNTKPTSEQIAFVDAVNRFGGKAGIARSDADLVKIIA